MKLHNRMHVKKAVSDASMRLFGIGGYLMSLFTGYRLICNGTMTFADVVYCFQVRGSMQASGATQKITEMIEEERGMTVDKAGMRRRCQGTENFE